MSTTAASCMPTPRCPRHAFEKQPARRSATRYLGTGVAKVSSMNAEPSEPATIRDRFLADHRRLETLLQRLLAAFEANDREDIQSLWTAFESSLLVHLEAEEKHLIPALLRLRERDARTILAEHRHIRGRLAELGTGIDLHIVRSDAARAFVEELRAHARNEDSLYGWADDRLDESERASLIGALAEKVRTALHRDLTSRAAN
jgi:hypothetical protein